MESPEQILLKKTQNKLWYYLDLLGIPQDYYATLSLERIEIMLDTLTVCIKYNLMDTEATKRELKEALAKGDK